jgi:hypothetical protein
LCNGNRSKRKDGEKEGDTGFHEDIHTTI